MLKKQPIMVSLRSKFQGDILKNWQWKKDLNPNICTPCFMGCLVSSVTTKKAKLGF